MNDFALGRLKNHKQHIFIYPNFTITEDRIAWYLLLRTIMTVSGTRYEVGRARNKTWLQYEGLDGNEC